MSESVASEVLSAMVGGAFSASALYPLEILKTRMQAETKGAAAGDADDGDGGDENDGAGAGDGDPPNAQDAHGGRVAVAGPAPPKQLSKLALKQRYQRAAAEGMGPYAALIYENEGGVAPFYAGVVTSAVQSCTEKALYFFAYTFLKNGYVDLTGNSNIGPVSNLVLGCFAEWAHLPVTLPIDCVTTAIQTDDKNRGAFVLMGAILSEKGLGGFYKGIEAYKVLCLKPAIQYMVYDQVKQVLLAARPGNKGGTSREADQSLGAAEAFFLGMFARIVATMLTYPYLRAKILLQSAHGNAKDKPTIPAMIAEQLADGGVWGLYQGIGPELTRGVFSAALMMMVKEKIGAMVRALIDGNRIEAQKRRQG